MALRILQVDAFSDRPFAGNPAAVCILPGPADPAWMQNVAREMNLSETAFLHKEKDGYQLRWFTPAVEVDLCGHATLASAHVLWEGGHLVRNQQARFHTRSGLLTAEQRGDWIELDFPATPAVPGPLPAGLALALGVTPCWTGRSNFDYLLEVDSEATVRALEPDFAALRRVEARGVIVTSRATTPGYDFVSRFFAPRVGVDEDPVTGSAHCALTPATSIGFWRVLLGTVCLALWGLLFRRALFRVDPRGWLLVGAGGGFLVALFEVAYQFAIAGAGVAGAAALLYTAPVIVALLARVLLKEALTVPRVLLALLVMAGVALTVTGGSNAGAEAARLGIGAGLAGGLLSALSYAGTTLLARFAVPRYGAVRVLFLEALGGIVILGIVLPLAGHPPTPPPSAAAWRGVAGLTAGAGLAPNLPFFPAVPRVRGPPAAVAATIEPVVGTLLALLLFNQRLSALGSLGLCMVVGGVAAGYLNEAKQGGH